MSKLRILLDGQAPRSRWVYRFEYDEERSESGPIGSLDMLADLLHRWGHHLDGLPWTELPTFGGTAPPITEGIWSWDETRILTGETASTLTLHPRGHSTRKGAF
ncbi:hypothetical protein [Stigmatella aurantiaca]|uniref:Uncharacterized protein n=1 Tax=Stigmatella aurantiaca (strain DW4/3-1) TaxID=378806 RepID=Q09DC5_STIAD|nr:hypothetical protein [Stigmatella aurantiaca]ADO69388.1 uncharacterized protein STAUR_1584 [Stigmatella aurantiaca DW4/3-1]EAU69773.1 hypothetical protein STIAU_1562 [Stigmatella aurantiaca DW4/3-1]